MIPAIEMSADGRGVSRTATSSMPGFVSAFQAGRCYAMLCWTEGIRPSVKECTSQHLAGRPIGFGTVEIQLAGEQCDVADESGQFVNADVAAGSDIDVRRLDVRIPGLSR